MKILFVEQFAQLGGAQRCLLDLMPAMVEAGHAPCAIIPAAEPSPLRQELEAIGVACAEYPAMRYASGKKTLRDHLAFAAHGRTLRRRIEETLDRVRPDVVYVNGPRPLPAAVHASRGRLPVLFHCHNRVAQATAVWLLRRAVSSRNVSVVSCCRHAAEPFAAACRDRLRVVMNGVEAPARVPARPGGSTAGVIGRVSPEKGQREFLQAARSAAERLPDARFVVVGDPLFDDPAAREYSGSLRSLASGLPVDLHGWREDVSGVLDGLDLLVVPSIREPATPRVVLEAYARGVPVVAFDTGGIAEILTDDETGRLVGQVTPAALADAIVDAFADRKRLARWSQAARERQQREFTLARYCAEMLDAVREAVGRIP